MKLCFRPMMIVLAAMVFVCAGVEVRGDEKNDRKVPTCESASLTLRIPTSMPGYQRDPDHVDGAYFTYTVTGCLFNPLARGKVPVLEDVQPLADDTVFNVIAKLRHAYATRNTDLVRSLYDEAGQKAIAAILADPEVRARYAAMLASMKDMHIALVFSHSLPDVGDVIVAYTIETFEGQEGRHASPLIFRNTGTAEAPVYRAMAAEHAVAMLNNLSVFLKDKDPGELLAKAE